MGSAPIIVIVGQEAALAQHVRAMGFRPVVVETLREAVEALTSRSPALILVNLPGEAVESRFLHQLSRSGVPILLAGDPATPAIRKKNVQILLRPVSPGALQAAVRAALPAFAAPPQRSEVVTDRRLGEEYLAKYVPLFIHSPRMHAIKDMIEQVADTNATILIRGESGVGKDIVARAIHAASSRHAHPFIKVNCAALPAELLESELFGHEKGAFTGAYRRKLGKFEFANKGTIFLDEIGELPLPLQAKLLHVLQDLEFSRIGGRDMIRVDVRVIASTNRNLEAALTKGEFREDLYHRLNVVEIRVPPLRERKEEIPVLAAYFLTKFNREYQRNVELSPEIIELFVEYAWPGNVRELENTARRVVVLGIRQAHDDLLARLRASTSNTPAPPDPPAEAAPFSASAALGLREIARRAAGAAEQAALKEILDRVHWNRAEAARILKVSYKTLLNKIAQCGLGPGVRRRKS